MKHNPAFDMDARNEDVFFLIRRPYLPAFLILVLARTGYFDIKELATFRKLNSRLPGQSGHPRTAGCTLASGSLGQGMSVAIGAALTKELNKGPTWYSP